MPTMYKRIPLIVCIFLMSSGAFAEVSLGVNLSTNLVMERIQTEMPQGYEYDRTTTYTLNLYPSLIIVPTSRIELVPTIGFSVLKSKRVTEDVDGNERVREDPADFGTGVGFGLYVRAIEGNVLRLSLGPDVFGWFYFPDGNDNEQVLVSIGLPANLDFLLNDRFFLRLSSRLVALSWHYEKQGPDDNTSTFTFFDIRSMILSSLGFYFTF